MKPRPVGERQYPQDWRDSRVAMRQLVRAMARLAARNYLQPLEFVSTFDKKPISDSTGSS